MDEQCVNLTDIKPADMLSIRTCFLSDKHCSMHQWCIVGCLSNIKHQDYRKTSNISRTFVGNNIVDNSDVVGAPPVGAAPTTSSFST